MENSKSMKNSRNMENKSKKENKSKNLENKSKKSSKTIIEKIKSNHFLIGQNKLLPLCSSARHDTASSVKVFAMGTMRSLRR